MFSLPTRTMTPQHNHCTFSSLSTVSLVLVSIFHDLLTAKIASCHYKNTGLQLCPQKIKQLFAFKA